MKCILSPSTDPYFNLASEEYLLKQFPHDVFLLYCNEACVVVGKHQNALAEIDPDYVRRHRIRVARRISGGGAVFHDEGNLNFAFLTTGKEGELVDYRRHTRPIVDALAGLGLEVHLGKRNELLLGEEKISGTASHVLRNRVLHHGTLLYNSKLEDLGRALKAAPGRFTDKAVKSVRSKVTNLSDHLAQPMTMAGFQQYLLDYALKNMERTERYHYSPADLEAIQSLRDHKFVNWEWNFGYSPRYHFRRTVPGRGRTLEVEMEVEKGIIRNLEIRGADVPEPGKARLQALLTGRIHDPETLRESLSVLRISEVLWKELDNEDFLSALF